MRVGNFFGQAATDTRCAGFTLIFFSRAAGARRATYLGGDTALPSDQRGPNKWFNTAAFAAPPTTGVGNAGIGTVMGPGWEVWNFSLRKQFAATERFRIQFRADAFNAMNHVNLNNPNTVIGGSFGTINSDQPPRQIQFGFNVSF